MKVYLLKQIPDEMWRAVKSQAALDGITVREVILRLLAAYLRQSQKPSLSPVEIERVGRTESAESEIG